MSTSESIRKLEDISQNDITGEVKGITPRAPRGVPDFSVSNTWIDRGEPGNLLTGKGATSDVAHFTRDQTSTTDGALQEWIRQYSEGRREFQDSHFENARRLSKEGQLAMAIIAARQVIEIPWRGSAFGGRFFGGYSPAEVDKALGLSGRHRGGGVSLAFSVPTKMKEELRGLIGRSREHVGEVGVSARAQWVEAQNGFELADDLHAAGLSTLELAQVEKKNDKDKPLLLLLSHKALGYIDGRTDAVLEAGDIQDTAELDELLYHLRFAVASTVRFDKDLTRLLVEPKTITSATYKLDDFGERREVVRDAYRQLARYSWRLRDTIFFNAEARGVEKQIKLGQLQAENPHAVLFDYPLRKDRRHKRPRLTP